MRKMKYIIIGLIIIILLIVSILLYVIIKNNKNYKENNIEGEGEIISEEPI